MVSPTEREPALTGSSGGAPPRPAEESPDASRFGQLWNLLRASEQGGIALGLIGLVALFAILSPDFLTSRNLFDILRQASVTGILAIGMTFVILTAGIDLSVGSILAIAGILSAEFATEAAGPIPILLAFGVPLLIGAAAGLFNGFGVAVLGVTPFVVTLGTLSIYRGVTLLYTDAQPVVGVESWYAAVGQGYIGPVPTPVVIFFALAALAALVLRTTRFGRYVYAVGGNLEAARAAAVPVHKVLVGVYVIAGACAGLAAIILTARLTVAQATAGVGLELTAIAAVVIGGTSLFGGKGGVGGTVIGALILAVLVNGLNVMNISSYIQQIVIGAILIAAVWFDERLRGRT